MSALSRRDFLKLGLLTLGSLAFRQLPLGSRSAWQPFLGEDWFEDGELVRVASSSVSVYEKPSDTSRVVTTWPRDAILHVYDTVTADTPAYNPVWYRVWGGYVHRARLQRVRVQYHDPLPTVRPEGQLAEVTVPYTQTYRFRDRVWRPLYRLYYGTVHWITAIEDGPDGGPWYRILDELLKVTYHAPARHLRPIADEEVAPISPDVPFEKKRIEVSLTQQTLTCYEDGKIVLQTKISSGLVKRDTVTPTGEYHIQSKYPSKHMGNGSLAADIEAYELVGVPWTCFFTGQGHALHGAYWHDNFGVPMSRGCINLSMADALFLFRWTAPALEMSELTVRRPYRVGFGTVLSIF